ncbi:MAG: redoxin domain-containing protein [Planctomycetota bacterium]|jgi:thiol-disulfide isomerase/thioredoxin|nr:redoxin domain-containing protein [Planctomycetota bacterium]|tara:strand:+ start:276 stop:1724 length:1449 start_codon:yes stop_codon:yes gene_type:complete
MKYLLPLLFLLSSVSRISAQEAQWIPDFDQAVLLAEKQNKDLLVDFTGSDWCGWCTKLHEEVFQHEAFWRPILNDFILVALDYPRKDPAKAAVPNPKRNQELKAQYGIRGFPTLLLMTASGEVYGQTGYRKGGPELYVEHIRELQKSRPKTVSKSKPVPVSASAPAASPREIEAADALEAIRAELGKRPPREPEERTSYFHAMHKAMSQFLQDWPGTWASIRAHSSAGQIELRILGQPIEGLSSLRSAYLQSKSQTGIQPNGIHIDSSRLALDLVRALVEQDQLDEAEKILQETAKGEEGNAERAKSLLNEIPILRRMQIGKVIPHFEGKGLDGELITPELFRGKVLLLDFWATWCGPCRAELPLVVSTYEEWNSKGFEVLGISLDRLVSEKDVQKAQADGAKRLPTRMDANLLKEWVEKNSMPWPQIYDGGYWKAAVAQEFAVHSIPFTILVDRNGIIRYKKVRGESLTKAVKTLMTEELK